MQISLVLRQLSFSANVSKKVSYFVFMLLLKISILSYFKYIYVKSILSVFSIQFWSNFSYAIYMTLGNSLLYNLLPTVYSQEILSCDSSLLGISLLRQFTPENFSPEANHSCDGSLPRISSLKQFTPLTVHMSISLLKLFTLMTIYSRTMKYADLHFLRL